MFFFCFLHFSHFDCFEISRQHIKFRLGSDEVGAAAAAGGVFSAVSAFVFIIGKESITFK